MVGDGQLCVETAIRGQASLFLERLVDQIGEDHLARIVDRFADELDPFELGSERTPPAHRAA